MESRRLVKNVIEEREKVGVTKLYAESQRAMELHGLKFTDKDIIKTMTKREWGK